MRVEHGLVDAGVAAGVALEGLGAEMVAKVVLEVVLVLGDEVALGAAQHLLGLDVDARVVPEVLLSVGNLYNSSRHQSMK